MYSNHRRTTTRRRRYLSKTPSVGAVLMMIILSLTSFAGWLTHVIVCLQDGAIGFLIAGALFFPIGVVHGIGLWFGIF